MISYLFLLLFSIVLFLVMLIVFKRKLYSPSILFLMGYILSIALAIIGLGSWNTEKELSLATIGIVCLTMLSFCVGELIVAKIKIRNTTNKKYSKKRPIYVSKITLLIFVAIYIIACVVIIRDLNGICNQLSCGATSIFEKIRFYHNNSALFSAKNAVSFSALNNWLYRIVNIISAYCIYVFFNNKTLGIKIKNNYYLLIPIALSVVTAFLRGGRSSATTFICAIVAMYFFAKSKNKNVSQLSMLKKIAPVAIGVLAIFYALVPLLGKATKLSGTEYISAYLGCPIPLLNIAIEQNITQGAETPLDNSLYGLRGFAQKLGIKTNNIERSSPFIIIGGFNTNVYTSIFRLYDDFGLLIALLFTILSGTFFGVLNKMSENKDDYRYIMFYILLASKIIDMCRDDTLYTLILTPNTIILIVLLIAICYVLYKTRNKKYEKWINVKTH